jgi:hypothetical protein
MAGILANSATETMVSGDTAASNVNAGYVAAEQITLSVMPTASTYLWGQAIPAGSAPLKSALTSLTDAGPRFVPDVAGEYVITCLVDGATSYVIRLSVVALTATIAVGAMRLLPIADASVPAPATGKTMYLNDAGLLSLKLPNNTIQRVTVT